MKQIKKTRFQKLYLVNIVSNHLINYPTPVNLNYLWSFGSLAAFCFAVQLITGIFLAMHYTPHVELAFDSIEHIMRDVHFGWLLRSLHSNGASFFFIAIYIHIARGLHYGSYINPRNHLWMSGILILLLTMAIAFMGYVLPWGQMSFWGATVITNLISSIPYIGNFIVEWLWGGFAINNATLNRFFSLHYLLPFILAALIIVHIALLHKDGSNNPLGLPNIENQITFYPYYVEKDLFSFIVFCFFASFFVFFAPDFLGHSDNYIPADPLSTPIHIVPEWYFLPYYAMLRSIPDKLGGVLVMINAILLLVLPSTIGASSKIRSARFKLNYRFFVLILFSVFIVLGWVGQQLVEYPFTTIGLSVTILYFIVIIIFSLWTDLMDICLLIPSEVSKRTTK